MYGKSTAGVVGSHGDILQAVAYAAVELAHANTTEDTQTLEDFVDAMNLSFDSMGLERIAY
jgi:hypothetical protein